jgi:hypothetical protein
LGREDGCQVNARSMLLMLLSHEIAKMTVYDLPFLDAHNVNFVDLNSM